MRKISSTLLGAAALAAALLPGVARADRRNPLAGQPTVRHRQELREFRLELTPLMGISFLEDFNHAVFGGAKINYHIKDWIALGGMFGAGTAVKTGVASEILGTLPPTRDDSKRGLPDQPTAERAMNKVAWLAALQAEITPMTGKFSLFSRWFYNYDFYLYGGVGFVNRTNELPADRNADRPQDCKSTEGCFGQNQGLGIGPTLGVGFHMYFSPAIALNVEFRDIMITDNPSGRDVNVDGTLNKDDKAFGNKFFWTIGLAFYLPWKPNISD